MIDHVMPMMMSMIMKHLIQHVYNFTELKQGKAWGKRLDDYKPCYDTLLSENQGTHCRERPPRKNSTEIQMLIEVVIKPLGHKEPA